MLNSISFSRFYNIDSDLRKMNPISKIICSLIFLILTFVDSSLEFNLILVFIVFCIILLSNIPLKVYLKIVLNLTSFIIFIFLVNFLCKVSIEVSILFSLRLVLIVLYSAILTMTTTPSELIYGLETILLPLKIFKLPVNSLALILSLAIRFIPTIFENGRMIIKTYESRGIFFRNLSLKLKLAYIKGLIIPMFILSVKDSDELADTISLRLYSVNNKRSNIYIYNWNRMDAYMLSFHVMLVVILIMKGIY